jgi:hypothetical protein
MLYTSGNLIGLNDVSDAPRAGRVADVERIR